jgi:ElaB/YqjD/DUF883 family membrane-anchored ribosome-binding protein
MEQSSFSTNQPSSNQASSTRESLEESTAQTAGHYLDKALHIIGLKMRQAASVVKERVPREGVARNAMESASRALESTGEYMMRQHPREEMGGVVRRHPLRAVGVCFLFGLIAGSVMRGARR